MIGHEKHSVVKDFSAVMNPLLKQAALMRWVKEADMQLCLSDHVCTGMQRRLHMVKARGAKEDESRRGCWSLQGVERRSIVSDGRGATEWQQEEEEGKRGRGEEAKVL